MVPPTRRRLLRGASALLAGLAGCQGESSHTSSSNDPRDAENVEPDPARVSLRYSADEPVVWVADEEPDDGLPTLENGPRVSERERRLIGSEETAARLEYEDVDGVGTARSFVAGTDFERETLLLETRRVRECYRLALCAITWSSTSYHTYYGRYLRPVDVACRVDALDRVSWLIRIPGALDPDLVRSYGSSTTSSGCEGYRRRFEDVWAEVGDGSSPDDAPDGDSGGPR